MVEPTEQTIYNWWNRHLVDTGRRGGTPTIENSELLAARRRIVASGPPGNHATSPKGHPHIMRSLGRQAADQVAHNPTSPRGRKPSEIGASDCSAHELHPLVIPNRNVRVRATLPALCATRSLGIVRSGGGWPCCRSGGAGGEGASRLRDVSALCESLSGRGRYSDIALFFR